MPLNRMIRGRGGGGMFLMAVILVLALFQETLVSYLSSNPDYYQLGPYTWESDDFRSMRLGDMAKGADMETLTALMVEHDYDLRELESLDCHKNRLMAARPADYRKLKGAYETVLEDLTYFPIPASIRADTPDVVFEDGWMDGRSYMSGGEMDDGNTEARRHEGCDIMGSERPRGFYPVVSMSDGVIEKIGWLEMGGWRIGIRAPKGAYLYYAHLYGYASDLKEGDRVMAGQLLGYMGDTGYGKTEGTTGNFEVHLHVGIYIRTDHYEEMSVNPYWILRWLKERRLMFDY